MQWEIPASHPVSPACEDMLRRLIVQVSVRVNRGAGGREGKGVRGRGRGRAACCEDILLRRLIVQVSGVKCGTVRLKGKLSCGSRRDEMGGARMRARLRRGLMCDCRVDVCMLAWLMCDCMVYVCMHAWLQDPLQRLTIDGIKAHPWFLELLPRNALTLSDLFMVEPPHARGECAQQS